MSLLYRSMFQKRKTAIIFLLIGIVYLVMGKLGFTCIYKKIWGIPCPGCGMTHAIYALISGDWCAAFQFHPMVFSLPILGFFVWKDGAIFKSEQANRIFAFTYVFLFGACYILRLCNGEFAAY